MPLVSVIIPLAPGEPEWVRVLEQFPHALQDFEILLCHDGQDDRLENTVSEAHPQARAIADGGGRARSMNRAADEASGKYLFFLHADSHLEEPALKYLLQLAGQETAAIHYHNLMFAGDGPFFMRLNEWGVWFRSHVLRMPFGDQGFFMSRGVFEQLGGYDEAAPYGEDHLLIWRAHQAKVPVRCTDTAIRTSARKYAAQGWAATTLKHLWLTARQAAPEFIKLIRMRLR